MTHAMLAELQGDWTQALEVRTEGMSEIQDVFWGDNARRRLGIIIALYRPSEALALNARAFPDLIESLGIPMRSGF
jgi:hypothetical protein